MLWGYDNVVYLDIIWMLILYLKLTGIWSGYLFPTRKRLLQGNLKYGVKESDAITYSLFCRSFARLCKAALGETRGFTGHTPRPTSFCMDIFRGAGNSDLKNDSRSKSLDNVCRYARGAGALKALMEIQGSKAALLLKNTYRMHRSESMNMLLSILSKKHQCLIR